MVQGLPVDIVEGGNRMMKAVDFQYERIPLAPHSLAGVLRIEEAGQGIACPGNQFFGTVGQCQTVKMCGQDTVCQKPSPPISGEGGRTK